LVGSSAWLVHLSGGYIEMHFHYFVMVTLLALYQDWTPFLFAVGYVVFQHGIGGYFWPHTVYNHPDAWSHPWKWAVIHAAFLGSSCIGVVIAWRANESARVQMENLLHSADEAFLGIGADGRVIFANRRAEAFLGIVISELIGSSITESLAPRLAPVTSSAEPAPLSILDGIVSQPLEHLTGQARLSVPGREVLVVEYRSSPLKERTQRGGVLLTLTDVTDRQRAEEEKSDLEDQLRQVQKMEAVGQLAGGIAHDFNNVLTIILGYGDLVLNDPTLKQVHRQSLLQVRDAGERASVLVQHLLAFSRKQRLAPTIVNLNDSIRGMEPMLRRLITESIALTTVLADDLRAVKVDAGQFEHIILNLALNARDAMPRGGQLTIETKNVELDETYVQRHAGATKGPHVLMSVSDTGHGMTPEVKSRIFEPFFTTKGQGKGTGLGLAMVYGTVKQSGGSIWVYSEVDKGTTIKIYLPQAEAPIGAAAAPVRPAQIDRRGSETILLVEDEDGVRTLARTILAEHGYNVLEAAGTDEAELFSRRFTGKIDLLLTDVVMPKANGQQLAEQLTIHRPEMKVLYTSGYTDDVIVRHGFSDAKAAFLEKPCTAEKLTSMVRQLLDART
jgi:signal transduction histidine kinase/CheY-like chemotaxis protein